MRKKRVWRYYCEFCKKAGCSGGHIRKHEESCTMNPNRVCGMCKMVEGDQKDIKELLAILPDPSDYLIEEEINLGHPIGVQKYESFQGLEEAVSEALPELRKLVDNCPACIMAALRQKGIPVPCAEGFNFTEECKELWSDINDANAQASIGYSGGYL